MIVVDTNVLSELFKKTPAAAVTRWVADRALVSLFTTTITQAEMMLGAAILPPGRRRSTITAALHQLFESDFDGRVLPFDSPAAQAYAALASERRRSGRPISQFDAQIAAIVRSRGGTLATRNTPDFEGCGIDLVDPWRPAD